MLRTRLLITGSKGFVGMNLCEYLKDDFDIEQMSVRYDPNQKIDIKAQGVIHLAGKAHDMKKVSSPKDYYDANFELTKQMFDAFLNSDATLFIFMSSVKAVADRLEGVLTEETMPNAQTHYGIAKRQAEQYILSKVLPENKRVYILRPCMIHGPGNKGNMNLLYQIASKGMPWPLGAFENKRSYCSVQNLCFVIKEFIKRKDITSGIYNVADDESFSTNQLIQIIAQSQNKKAHILNIPKGIIRFVSKLGDLIRLPLNSERLEKLTENYVVSNDKLKIALGNSLPVKTKDGLSETFRFFHTSIRIR